MKNRKSLFLVLILTLVLSLASVSSFAAEENKSDAKILYKQAEITDSEMLYQRAKNNITDSKIKNVNAQIKLENNSEEIEKIASYETTQLLESKQVDDSTIETYVTTLIEDVKLKNDTRSSTSSTGTLTDTTTSYQVYSKIYYTLTQRGGASDITIKYYAAKGWWINLDTSVQGSNRKLKAKMTGTNYISNCYYACEKSNNPSSDSGAYFSTFFPEFWLDDYSNLYLFTSIDLTRWGNTTIFSTLYSGDLNYNQIVFSISQWTW